MDDNEGIRPEDMIGLISERAADKVLADSSRMVVSRESSLLLQDRAIIDRTREQIDQRRELFQMSQLRTEQRQLAQWEKVPEALHEVRDEAIQALREDLRDQARIFVNEQLAHIKTTDLSVAMALEAFFDTNTPLYTRKALVRTCALIHQNESSRIESDETYEPVQVHFEIADGMLFHAANTIRSATGLDMALRSESQAQIGLARAFAKDYTPYQPFESDEQRDSNSFFQDFVLRDPSNSSLYNELRTLDGQNGNSFECFPIRLNAGGGDEFVYTYVVKGPDASRMLALGRQLTMGINHKQVLVPEYDIAGTRTEAELTQAELDRREAMRQNLGNNVNSLKFNREYPYNDPTGRDRYQKTVNSFLDEYRHYIRRSDNEYMKGVFADPSHDLTMDQARLRNPDGSLPSMDDAIMCFITGYDAQGNRLNNGKGVDMYGFYTSEGVPDEQKIELYVDSMADRVLAQLRSDQLSDPTAVAEAIDRNLQEDIFNSFMDYLNDNVNEVAKPQKKKEVFAAALALDTDPSAAFNVGATFMTGRHTFVELTYEERLAMALDLLDQAERIIASDDPRAPLLKQAMDQATYAFRQIVKDDHFTAQRAREVLQQSDRRNAPR